MINFIKLKTKNEMVIKQVLSYQIESKLFVVDQLLNFTFGFLVNIT